MSPCVSACVGSACECPCPLAHRQSVARCCLCLGDPIPWSLDLREAGLGALTAYPPCPPERGTEPESEPHPGDEVGACFGAELCPPNSYFEALTLRTPECGLIWRQDFRRGREGKMRSLGWPPSSVTGAPISSRSTDTQDMRRPSTQWGERPWEEPGLPTPRPWASGLRAVTHSAPPAPPAPS